MNIQQIKDIRDARPFREFILELNSGHKIEIPTRDHLFFLPNKETIIAYSADSHICIVDVVDVSALILNEGVKK